MVCAGHETYTRGHETVEAGVTALAIWLQVELKPSGRVVPLLKKAPSRRAEAKSLSMSS